MKRILLLQIATCFVLLASATTRYVATSLSGTTDGSSWTNASASIQSMIDSSAYGDTVWVKGGTYFPSQDPFGNATPIDVRDKTFYLKNGVKLFGSFAGTENSLGERTLAVINANQTILNGDLGTTGDSTDNAYHVILSVQDDSTTVVDGFTITNGSANGSGAIWINSNALYQAFGAGMFNFHSSCTISNCIFSNNHTASLGGGMFNTNSSVTVSNCVFEKNSSLDQGGGMDNEFASTVMVSNCIFWKNRAVTGGGILNEINALLKISNCTFSNNFASGSGGGVNSDSTLMQNCIVFGNNDAPALNHVSHSIIEGATVVAGIGNTNANPRFADSTDADGADNIWRTADDGLRILPCSPAVDMGTDIGAPSFDILSNTRIDVIVPGISIFDIGAYENMDSTPNLTLQIHGDTILSALTSGNFQWIFCADSANATGVSTNSFYVSPQFNSYALKITEETCTYISDCVVAGPDDIKNIVGESGWKIFPNPTRSTFAVEAKNNSEEFLLLTDVAGKILLQQKISERSIVDVSKLQSGIYLITIGGTTQKLMIE
jgi:predicted outer membrane repeat protein